MSQTYITRSPAENGGNTYTVDGEGGQVVGVMHYLTDASDFAPRFNLVRHGVAAASPIQNPGAFHSLEALEYFLLACVIEGQAQRVAVGAREAQRDAERVDISV